jgi:hypothetical protein
MKMTGRKLLALGLAAALSTTAAAVANASQEGYVEGENVYVCTEPRTFPLYGPRLISDCRVNGEKTTGWKEAVVDGGNGKKLIGYVDATIFVKCSDKFCYSQWDHKGIPQGTQYGRSVPGLYLVESDWYIAVDENGNPTAYQEDVGPLHGQALFAKAQPGKGAYGTEACYQNAIDDIHEENPGFPISFDMMNEMRAECGLPSTQ